MQPLPWCQRAHLRGCVTHCELFVGILVFPPCLTSALLGSAADSVVSAPLCLCVDCPYDIFRITPVARLGFFCQLGFSCPTDTPVALGISIS